MLRKRLPGLCSSCSFVELGSVLYGCLIQRESCLVVRWWEVRSLLLFITTDWLTWPAPPFNFFKHGVFKTVGLLTFGECEDPTFLGKEWRGLLACVGLQTGRVLVCGGHAVDMRWTNTSLLAPATRRAPMQKRRTRARDALFVNFFQQREPGGARSTNRGVNPPAWSRSDRRSLSTFPHRAFWQD